ncbi:isoaspartyl peptidase/L-asparaginase [Desulfovibrio sp. OttesenSCG-928-C06]|nr:isoaspartyl peptidase/L-asparaginase [Desulfovibrio sp. OttesenSCG-928-C06]
MKKYSLAIHGGAGTISRKAVTPEKERAYTAALYSILEEGQKMLAGGASALDVATQAVVRLEDCPLFNAGHGAVFNSDGVNELDASIMDGATRSAGAVALLKRVRNPILAARTVMESGLCVFMAGDSADDFARSRGLEMVEQSYFFTQERMDQLEKVKAMGGMFLMLDHDAEKLAAESPDGVSAGTAADASAPGTAGERCTSGNSGTYGEQGKSGESETLVGGEPIESLTKFGTVGAVARDIHGNLAAANSTGGLTNKIPGRIGDSAVIGAGCYADNAAAAIATTGTGETFIRGSVAHDIVSLMKYSGLPLHEAVGRVLSAQESLGGTGGLVAVDAAGNVALPFITDGMYRGSVVSGEPIFTAIYK